MSPRSNPSKTLWCKHIPPPIETLLRVSSSPQKGPGAPDCACRLLLAAALTFCRVWGGIFSHLPKTGPWSLVVRRSSLVRRACSSSETMRKVPVWG